MNASVYTCMCKQQEEHAAGPTERVSTVESSALLIRHGGDLSVNRKSFFFFCFYSMSQRLKSSPLSPPPPSSPLSSSTGRMS